MKNDPEEDALREYLENQVKKFEQHSYYLEKFRKILAVPDHTYFEDMCDGFCPECIWMSECEVYEMIEDEWDGFYT